VHQDFDDDPPPKRKPDPRGLEPEAADLAEAREHHGGGEHRHRHEHGHRHRRRHRSRGVQFDTLRARYKKAIFIAIGVVLALVTTWFVLVRANVPPTEQLMPAVVP
jgi:hypothetical protein